MAMYEPPEGKMADELGGDASGSRLSIILGGFIVPLILIGNGILDVIFKEANFPGKGGSMALTGTLAIVMGIVYIGAGAFLHFHYFWTVSEKLFRLATPAKTLALLISLLCFGYVGYHIIMN